MEQYLQFEETKTDAGHMIAEDELLARFDDAISAYDLLEDEYSEALSNAA